MLSPSSQAELIFIPIEDNAYLARDAYIMRAPGKILDEVEAVSTFLADAAQIGNVQRISIKHLLEQSEETTQIATNLKAHNFDVETILSNPTKTLSPEQSARISWLCMDKRAPSRRQPQDITTEHELSGVIQSIKNEIKHTPRVDKSGEKTLSPFPRSRLKLPGSALLAHPDILKNLPEAYRSYIEQTLHLISETKWKIDKIVPHIGLNVNGDKTQGCGGTRLAKEAGASIQNVDDLIHYLKKVRSKHHKIMTTNCDIFLDVTFPDHSVVRVSADDFNHLFEEDIQENRIVL